MKVTSALSAILVSIPEALEHLRSPWGGIAAAVIIFLAGMGTMATFGDLGSHEGRISAVERVLGFNAAGEDTLHTRVEDLEEWERDHVREVTRPNVRKIGAVEETQQQILTRLGRMESRLDRIETLIACDHYNISDCPGAPPPPPTPQGP